MQKFYSSDTNVIAVKVIPANCNQSDIQIQFFNLFLFDTHGRKQFRTDFEKSHRRYPRRVDTQINHLELDLYLK